MATIFLAHGVADRYRALALASGLRSAGLTVLAETPPAGDNGWWAGLLAAVQDVDVFLYATTPGSAATLEGGGTGGGAPLVVAALRDYAAAIGIPTLEVHLSGVGEAIGIDFRRPTADAAFLLVGAIAALPGRPPVARWQVQPESPFARVVDLAREVQAPTDQRALVDRLRVAAGDPAVRELAAIFRQRPDLDAENARHLDEAFPASASRPPADPSNWSPTDDRGPDAAGPRTSGPAPVGPRTSGPGASPAHEPELAANWSGSAGLGANGSDAAGLGWGEPQGAGQPWQPPGGGLGADDVRSVSFRKAGFGRRGYDEQEVDEFLDQVERNLRARYAGGAVVKVSLTSVDVHEVAFKRPPGGRRGYDERQVDGFLDQIERTLAALDQALAAHGSAVSKR